MDWQKHLQPQCKTKLINQFIINEKWYLVQIYQAMDMP